MSTGSVSSNPMALALRRLGRSPGMTTKAARTCDDGAAEIERLERIEQVAIELARSAQDWGNQVAVSEEVFTHLETALEVHGAAPETTVTTGDERG